MGGDGGRERDAGGPLRRVLWRVSQQPWCVDTGDSWVTLALFRRGTVLSGRAFSHSMASNRDASLFALARSACAARQPVRAV